MTTVLEDNVHNFAVDGTSDDLDVPIKVGIEPYVIQGVKKLNIIYQLNAIHHFCHQVTLLALFSQTTKCKVVHPGEECKLL